MVEEWNWVLLIHYLLKANSQLKRTKNCIKRKAAKKPKRPGNFLPPRSSCGSHHRPWWALASRALPLPECCVLFFTLDHGSYLGSSVLGLLGIFCKIFWSSRPQKYLLILWFRLVNLNSAKMFKMLKTMHNRRNMDTNRITMHFNTLKMTPKHLINPCKCDTYHCPMLELLLVFKQNTTQDQQGEMHLGLINTRTSFG